MTTVMRMRLWGRQAPRSQILTLGVVLGVVLGLLGFATAREDGPANAATEISTVGGAGADTLGAGDVATGPSGADADGALAGSGADGGPAASGGPGDTTPTPGESAVPGSPSAGPGGSSVGLPSGGPPASGGANPASGAPAGEAPVASDQGVTAETIKIGFTLNRPAGLNATGFAFGLRRDDAEAIEAMVDHVNKKGGVKGRKVTHVAVEVDPTNRASWQTACLRLTEDEKVFAVLNPGAYLGTGHSCYVEHRVPQATTGSVSLAASVIRDARGYVASTYGSATRVLLNWASTMLDAGVIGAGKPKVGLLTDDCPEYVEPWKQLESMLKGANVQFVTVRLSCDIGAAQQQVPSAVLQMRRAGVGRVFLGAIFSTDQTFMQQAEAQGWRPEYSVSDLWANNVDPLAKNFPPDQFDGALGSAANHSGEEAAKVPYSPGVQKCNEMITQAGLPPITDQMGKDAGIISHCDNFLLWLAVMEHLPVNFTRDQWAAAVPKVGAMKLPAVSATATFGPGKFEGGDSYAIVEWRRGCTCWVQVKRHRPAEF